MSLLDLLFPKRAGSATQATERLKLVLAHERAGKDAPDFLPLLQRELLAVIANYVAVSEDRIETTLGHRGGASVLEITIELPQRLRPSR